MRLFVFGSLSLQALSWVRNKKLLFITIKAILIRLAIISIRLLMLFKILIILRREIIKKSIGCFLNELLILMSQLKKMVVGKNFLMMNLRPTGWPLILVFIQ